MKRTACLFFLITLFLIAPKFRGAVYAQYFKLELENPGQQIKVNDVFNVNLSINTEGVEAINGDALLLFDPAKISILNGQSQNFFTFAFSTMISGVNNKYLASSWDESVAHEKSSSVDTPFYTLSVKAVGNGQTEISFECATGSEADSNINRSSDATDVISCPLTPLSLSIGETTGPTTPPQPTATSGPANPTPTTGDQQPSATNTPVPTRTPVPTAIPTNTPIPTTVRQVTTTPAELPRAGIISDTLGVLGVGTFLTVLGLLFML